VGRTLLTGGVLDVRLVTAERRWARARLVITALLRHIEDNTVYEVTQVDRVAVRADQGLSVAVDGEVFDAASDFEVRVRPRALQVLVPTRRCRRPCRAAAP
jgi:undecaprenyl-diphosphatase